MRSPLHPTDGGMHGMVNPSNPSHPGMKNEWGTQTKTFNAWNGTETHLPVGRQLQQIEGDAADRLGSEVLNHAGGHLLEVKG